ncbi:MAG: peroxide stress protein YaaA [Legionellaceae bacterium]|nr:peroxide stress protein YaaA [Legionellaceae bacterium]
MLTLLSPAKKLLDFESAHSADSTNPLFIQQAQQLIALLQQKSEGEIAALMRLSPTLARLNKARYAAFTEAEPGDSNSYPALYLFQGDVYQALDAKSLSADSIQFAQKHLAILSGLYGLLRPLDHIQPYRLEMGTKLVNPAGATLYDFWADHLTAAIDKIVAQHQVPLLLNLASSEYFKAVDSGHLQSKVLHVHFKEEKNGQQKIIGIHAKKARGRMARFIVEHQLDSAEALKDFRDMGYGFSADQSDAAHFVFIRQH